MKSETLLLLGLCAITFMLGYKLSSYNEIQEKLKQAKHIEQLTDRIRESELVHRTKENELIMRLEEEKSKYAENVAHINNDYTRRLQQSNNRADTYKRQAESAAECAKLANFTGKLDRSLEEGRALVRELGEIAKFQQQQLDYCTAIIKNDRELLK